MEHLQLGGHEKQSPKIVSKDDSLNLISSNVFSKVFVLLWSVSRLCMQRRSWFRSQVRERRSVRSSVRSHITIASLRRNGAPHKCVCKVIIFVWLSVPKLVKEKIGLRFSRALRVFPIPINHECPELLFTFEASRSQAGNRLLLKCYHAGSHFKPWIPLRPAIRNCNYTIDNSGLSSKHYYIKGKGPESN